MDSYVPRETPAEAYRDRSRLVLLPATILAWTVGALLLLVSASALITVLVGAATSTVHVTLHTMTALPSNAPAIGADGGPSVVNSTSPVMTDVQASIAGLPATTATALRLAPALELATSGAVSVLVGLVISRVGSRRAASRLLLAATLLLIGGSVVAESVGAVGGLGIRSVSWSGIPQIEQISNSWTTAFDPAPLAVAVGLLVVVHLLRRLEGAGVLTRRARPRP